MGILPGPREPLRPWARGNLVAGVTVTAYLVPQCMAYATVAGLPTIVGLWAALPALLIYALLGTSRLLSLGPESSVALMTAATVAPIAASDPGRYATLVAAMALIVGILGLLAGLARLAFISDLLSLPVLVGYMAGIGLLMIEGQLDNFLGIETDADAIPEHLRQLASGASDVNPAVPFVGVVVLVLLFAVERWAPRWPGPLLAMIAAAGIAAVVDAVNGAVPLVGTVPQGLPLPQVPWLTLAELQLLAVGALGILLVGFTDTALTARAFVEPDDPRPDQTAELRAMSVGNVAVGLLQGMPVSSSGSRTALARTAGAVSQGYSLVAAVAVTVVLLVAAPLLSGLPMAGLAALVIYAAVHLIDVRQFRQLWHFSRIEFALAVITMLGVLWVGILYGVLIAVGLSVLAMAAQSARPHTAALGFVPGLPGMHDIEDFDDVAELPGLLVYRYDSPLFFANAEHFLADAQSFIRERQPGLRWFALNCEAIVEVDSTAVNAFGELIEEVGEMGLVFCLVRAKGELVDQLSLAGLTDGIGTDRIYPTLPSLVEAYRAETGTTGPPYATPAA